MSGAGPAKSEVDAVSPGLNHSAMFRAIPHNAVAWVIGSPRDR